MDEHHASSYFRQFVETLISLPICHEDIRTNFAINLASCSRASPASFHIRRIFVPSHSAHSHVPNALRALELREQLADLSVQCARHRAKKQWAGRHRRDAVIARRRRPLNLHRQQLKRGVMLGGRDERVRWLVDRERVEDAAHQRLGGARECEGGTHSGTCAGSASCTLFHPPCETNQCGTMHPGMRAQTPRSRPRPRTSFSASNKL
jgi:hypothetical protein